MQGYSYSIGDRSEGAAGAVSKAELVAGMQLLRAVNMQSVRLQLAMLKREQRPAIESLDTLTEMDRELEHFIEGMGPAGLSAPELREISELIAIQKSALAREKIALMAGISGPKLAGIGEPLLIADQATLEDSTDTAESEYRSGIAGKLVALTAVFALAGAVVGGWLFSTQIAAAVGLQG